MTEMAHVNQFKATIADAFAHAVGYESASQFSREYKRLFGASPSAYRGEHSVK